jgi:hypothetical protein
MFDYLINKLMVFITLNVSVMFLLLSLLKLTLLLDNMCTMPFQSLGWLLQFIHQDVTRPSIWANTLITINVEVNRIIEFYWHIIFLIIIKCSTKLSYTNGSIMCYFMFFLYKNQVVFLVLYFDLI